jgi:hypothetical protein
MKKLNITQQVYEEIMVQCQRNLHQSKVPKPSSPFRNP